MYNSDYPATPLDVSRLNQRSLGTLRRALRLGQGEFSLILVCCNYQALVQEIWQQLILETPPLAVSLLPEETNLIQQLPATASGSVHVFGWEYHNRLEQLLVTTNQLRNELQRHCAYPLVLWINDRVSAQMLKLAADLKSWSITTLRFTLPSSELVRLGHRTGEALFQSLLEGTEPPSPVQRLEWELALQDLQMQGLQIPPGLQAALELVKGRDAAQAGDLRQALAQYHRSLTYWLQAAPRVDDALPSDALNSCFGVYLERQGLIWWHLALVYGHPDLGKRWRRAESCLASAHSCFAAAPNPVLAAQMLLLRGEIWLILEDWEQLASVAAQAMADPTIVASPRYLARVYGFLGNVALAQGKIRQAGEFAQLGLSQEVHNSLLLLLAKVQRHQGDRTAALQTITRANTTVTKSLTEAWSGDALAQQTRLEILELMRSLYWEQGQYLQAFVSKQARYQLVANSTKTAVNASLFTEHCALLLARLGRADHKLTVLHGQAGVGKTALVNTGLVPALQGKVLGTRLALTVVQSTYHNWVAGVNRQLGGLEEDHPLDRLKQCLQANFLVVLIFDQWEEFSSKRTDLGQKWDLYEFLASALRLPFVKVILVIREEALHQLLELERFVNLTVIDHNILDRHIRYHLEDLSPETAKRMVDHLEPALGEVLIKDLAAASGRVRLMELQVISTVLQQAQITTLEQYYRLGADPKTVLIQRHLQQIVEDCGPENRAIAWQILFTLTDPSQYFRPQKTAAELAPTTSQNNAQLTSTLAILTRAGLLVCLGPSYQLAHYYLNEPIRQAYLRHLQTSSAAKIAATQARLCQVQRQHWRAMIFGLAMAGLAAITGGTAWIAEQNRRAAQQASLNAQVSSLSSASEALFTSGKQFEALLSALRGGRLAQTSLVTPDTQWQLQAALHHVVSRIREQQRFTGHRDIVTHVAFSPDGSLLASAGSDRTVQIWRPNGQTVAILQNHTDVVTSISFSPDGQWLASSSWDGTVKIWQRWQTAWRLNRTLEVGARAYSVSFGHRGIAIALENQTVQIWSQDGQRLAAWSAHDSAVTWVSFAPCTGVDCPDTLATAGEEGTIKVWSSSGELLGTLVGHRGKVNAVKFSPDGQWLVSAGDDQTAKLWRVDNGQLVQTLAGHQGWVLYADFSPNGEQIVSASRDDTVRVWRTDGTLVQAFIAHSDRINAATFSPDGQLIASASEDKTVKLWLALRRTGQWQAHSQSINSVALSGDRTLIASAGHDQTVKLWQVSSPQTEPIVMYGHTDRITAVQFSGDLLASASRDQTIRLWDKQGRSLAVLRGHQDWVTNLAFSPDGQILASTGRDRTIRLWSRQGQAIAQLVGHSNRVNAVTFSPDGQMIATSSDDQTIRLWTREGKLLHILQGHQGWVLDVAFSRDGQWLASAGYDNRVMIWNRQGQLSQTLSSMSDSVARVHWLDDQIIATTSWNNQVQLWRRNDTLITSLTGHRDSASADVSVRITSMAWDESGQLLVTSGQDGTIQIWHLRLADLIHNSCQWLHNYLLYSAQNHPRDRWLCRERSPTGQP